MPFWDSAFWASGFWDPGFWEGMAGGGTTGGGGDTGGGTTGGGGDTGGGTTGGGTVLVIENNVSTGIDVATKTLIANMALSRMGVSKYLHNIESDRGKEASALNLVFDHERDAVLRSFPWPFATQYRTLGLVAGTAAAPVSRDWVYAYRYPSDCLFARRIVTDQGRRETKPAPFKVGRDTQGKLVLTDEPNAELEYTGDILDATDLDPLFASALSWRLVAATGTALSRVSNILKLANEGFDFDIGQAKVAALNEGQADVNGVEAETIRARE